MSDDEARKRRSEERRLSLVLRKTSLSEVHAGSHLLRGADAVSMVRVLTDECWLLSGRPWPDYSREATPYRFVPRP